MVGLGEAGLWCLLAAAAAPQDIKRLAANLAGFDPGCDAEFLERLNVPHIRRAGDLVAMTALLAPRPLLVHNLAPGFEVPALRAMYRAAGNSQATDRPAQPRERQRPVALDARPRVMALHLVPNRSPRCALMV